MISLMYYLTNKTCIKPQLEFRDIVTFGEYKERQIDWIVLEANKEQIRLLSLQVLDAKYMNEKSTLTYDWKTCSLREWLNDTFYNAAFRDEEKPFIKMIDNDYVTLLTAEGVFDYFPRKRNRACYPSEYAKQKGVIVNKQTKRCLYWTKSRGGDAYSVKTIDERGRCDDIGIDCFYGCEGVRPVITVKNREMDKHGTF